MPRSGYTGISFPFRVSSRGGCVLSTTSMEESTHITESIQQIFSTHYLERPMEKNIYTTVSEILFNPNNITLQQMLKMQMLEDLRRLESRVSCEENNITFSVEVADDGISYLYADILYKVIKYDTYYNGKVRLGEVNTSL